MKTPNFEKILLLCKRFLRPPVDAENVAAEIVLESWKKGKDAGYLYIKSRCYDELRRFRKEETFRRSLQVKQERCELEEVGDVSSYFESSIRKVLLSRDETNVLYLKFYKELTHEEIGRSLGLPQYKVSLLISTMLEKMREGVRSKDVE